MKKTLFMSGFCLLTFLILSNIGTDASLTCPLEEGYIDDKGKDSFVTYPNATKLIKSCSKSEEKRVLAVCNGVISKIRKRNKNDKTIYLEDERGFVFVYRYVDRVNVKEGDIVIKGFAIGEVRNKSPLVFSASKDGVKIPISSLGLNCANCAL